MDKINFIVIKQYEDKKVELHVFTNDGEESIYCLSNGGIDRAKGYTQLKNLAEQNGLSYSAKGLRSLRDLGLLYNMNEQEFNMAYEVMKQGNENQAHYEEKKLQKQLPQQYKPMSDFFTFDKTSQESTNLDNQNQLMVPRRIDDLDSNNIQEFVNHQKSFLERKREELENDFKKFSGKKRGIVYRLKRIAMLVSLIYVTVSSFLSGFGSNKNVGKNENKKAIESTLDNTKNNTAKTVSTAEELIIKSQKMRYQEMEAQRKQREKEEQERKQKEKEEKERKQREKEEKERKQKEKEERERQQREKEERERQQKEKEEQERKQKEKEEKERQQKEQEARKRKKNASTSQTSNGQYATYKTRMTSYWAGDGYTPGVTTGSGKGIKDFQTNEKGWYTYHGKLVVGTATTYLLKYGYTLAKGVHTYKYYDELTLTIDGKNYEAIVLDSCGSSMTTDRIDLFVKDGRHAKDTTITVRTKQKVKTR